MARDGYDLVPYGGHSVANTHPENLFTIARLFGLDPPDYRTARVLELGCGQGDNLLPLAANLPRSRFWGIDLSARQIEPGRQCIEALGLTNITLAQRSILDVGPDLGRFDYIICHGVYSWVPAEVREKILSICSDCLSENGVAYVSYNCRPGWNMIQSIRDMMRFHVADFQDPEEKAEQARTMLKFIIDSQGRQDSAYAAYLQSEFDLLSQHRDAYLLHDHLEEINYPLYFHEFISQAERFGLAYLAETDLESMFPDNLLPSVAQKIREIKDIIKSEQYMDFVRNRRFRCTLLCHGHLRIRRDLHVNDIEKFFVASRARPGEAITDKHLADGVPMAFRSGQATAIIRGRVPKTAMAVLQEQQGKPMSHQALCTETAARTGATDPEWVQEQINEELNLLRLLFAGLVCVSASPGDYLAHVPRHPRVTRLARYQASRGNTVTNQRHRTLYLGPAKRILIQYLDGTRDLEALTGAMNSHLASGELVLKLDGEKTDDPERRQEAADILCNSILAEFAARALLVESDP